MPPVDAAYIPVATAAIAALVALLGLIIGKDLKVSEFRQAWIEALRIEVGILIAQMFLIRRLYKEEHEESPGERRNKLSEQRREAAAKFNDAATKIRLRVNPDPKQGKPILDAIFTIETHLHDTEDLMDDQSGSLNRDCKTLIQTTQIHLKANWKVVKRGEWFYRTVKWAITIIAILSFGVLANWGIRAHYYPNLPSTGTALSSPHP